MTEITVKLICDMSDIEAKMGRINASMQKSFSPARIEKVYKAASKGMETSMKKGAVHLSKAVEIAVRSMRSAKFGGIIRSGLEKATAGKEAKGGGELGLGEIIVGAIGALTVETVGAVLIAGAMLQIVSKLYEGIMWGFTGLMKAVGILGKVIGAIIRPFAGLFIPIVVLLARLLLPVARILRLILMPIYRGIQKGISEAAKGGVSGAALGATAGVIALEQFGLAIEAMFAGVWGNVVKGFIDVGTQISEVITVVVGGVGVLLLNALGASGAADILSGAIKNAILTMETFRLVAGAALDSGVKVFTANLYGLGLAAQTVKDTQLSPFQTMLLGIGSAFGIDLTSSLTLANQNLDAFNLALSNGVPIADAAMQAAQKLALQYDLGLSPATYGVRLATEQLQSQYGYLVDYINNTMTPAIKNFQSALSELYHKVSSKWDTLSGMIPGHQTGGDIDSTGLYYLHKGETVTPASSPRGGGGNTSVTINISGAGMDTKTLVRELSKELQKQLGVRSTYGTGF